MLLFDGVTLITGRKYLDHPDEVLGILGGIIFPLPLGIVLGFLVIHLSHFHLGVFRRLLFLV